jgi:hypothetical protein
MVVYKVHSIYGDDWGLGGWFMKFLCCAQRRLEGHNLKG